MTATPQEPIDVIHAVLRASERKDADAYLANYLEDAVMRRADGVVLQGREAIEKNFNEYVESERTRHVEIFDSLTLVQADTALVCTSYKMTFTGGTQPESLFGRSHDVLKLQADGTWLLSIDHPYEPYTPEEGSAYSQPRPTQ